MGKSIRKLGYSFAALALVGFTASAVGGSSDTEVIPFTSFVQGGSGCPGMTYGSVTMTNSSGSLWIVPPTNTVTATFTNLSSLNCAVSVVRASDFMGWCSTNNGVTFPATSSTSYHLTAFARESGATNGQPITVQINWQ